MLRVGGYSNMLQPEYTDYCKKCKQKTTYEFNEYVDGKRVSYKCKNCGNIRATTLKDGDKVIVY